MRAYTFEATQIFFLMSNLIKNFEQNIYVENVLTIPRVRRNGHIYDIPGSKTSKHDAHVLRNKLKQISITHKIICICLFPDICLP